MLKKNKPLGINDPLKHPDHRRPITRREFIQQGFIGGPAMVLGGGIYSLFSNPGMAEASDLGLLAADFANCKVGGPAGGSSKIPFICFDLAGGANFAGSNVMVGTDTQMDFLSVGAYSKMGLPANMVPGQSNPSAAVLGAMQNLGDTNFINNQLGLLFHSDSSMLKGILEKFTSVASGRTEGAVIPARSGNDTGNNPHNPLYGIAKAGAVGDAVTIIGSRNTESGGNSMAPQSLVNPEIRPTKVDNPNDVTGMVDVGDLTAVFNSPEDVTAVMESMARISHKKLNRVSTKISSTTIPTKDEIVKDLVRCGYIKAADIAERFAGRPVDPNADTDIVEINEGDGGSIFSRNEFNDEREFRKTASVMKMVVNGFAGAGCVTMGGYDYHTGNRRVGELRDLRAGRCIGACLEYAARLGKAIMIYVYSDGSVASNGDIDGSVDGRNKSVWTGDNSSTACSFFLVYNPNGTIETFPSSSLIDPRQIGSFTPGGSVVTASTPAANNVNLLVNTVLANYMALNGDIGEFTNAFPNHGLGDQFDNYISFGPLT